MVARVVDDARCPGALHAVEAVDGLLARVRIPGGYIATRAFRALADLAEHNGDGNLDITARASLQIRGLTRATREGFAVGLASAGLLPSTDHERVRNVVASTFAGYDATELVDVRPVVRAFDAGLVRDPELAKLPAKFVVAIDGCGLAPVDPRADLGLRAMRIGVEVRFAFTVGGVDTGTSVAIADGAALLLGAARTALAVARGIRGDDRTWRIVASRTASPRAPQPRGIVVAHDDGFRTIVPSVPLGRLTAAQARVLATLADEFGAEIRLGAWRGVALVGIARPRVDDAVAALARIGLVLDNMDGFDGLAACAGPSGCASALADVRADAVDFASRALDWQPMFAWTMHVAGCEKRCAMRGGADVDLIARADGYEVLAAGKHVLGGATAAVALDLADEIRRDAIRLAGSRA